VNIGLARGEKLPAGVINRAVTRPLLSGAGTFALQGVGMPEKIALYASFFHLPTPNLYTPSISSILTTILFASVCQLGM